MQLLNNIVNLQRRFVSESQLSLTVSLPRQKYLSYSTHSSIGMEFFEANKPDEDLEEVLSSTIKSEIRRARVEMPLAGSTLLHDNLAKMKHHSEDSDHEDEEEVKGIEGMIL